ncbi:MAG: LysO family transporter [Clostridium sp.]
MNILIALVLGAIVGYFLKLGEKGKNINGKLQQLGVIFLLFSMGASIGADKDIIKNLPTIGLKSFLFAVATIGVSIVIVYALSEKFMPKESKLHNKEELDFNKENQIENNDEFLNDTCEEGK